MKKLLTISVLALSCLFVTPHMYNGVKAEESTSSEVVSSETSGETSSEVSSSTTSEEDKSSTEPFDFGKWMEEHFTAQTITTITSVLTMLAVVLKLVSYTKSLAKEKNTTMEDVKTQVIEILNTTNKESVEKSINDLVAPLEKEVGSITPVLNAFAKILALSQENTPESRIAILELIQELGNVSGNIVEKAKEEVNKQVEEENKEQEEKIELLTQIEQKNTTSTPVE